MRVQREFPLEPWVFFLPFKQIKDKDPGLEVTQIIPNYNIQMQKLKSVIGPSILSADFANLQADCQNVLDCGADSLHIDIMDGHFVNNLTFGPPVVASLRKKLPLVHFDCHLMVTHPQNYIQPLSKCKADCFTFHYEVVDNNFKEICEKIKNANMEVGVSLKPGTQVPNELLELAREGVVNKILVMTVEPGFGGQKFMENMMPKVKYLRQQLPDTDIQVDGGLTLENIELAAKSGANCIVAGSSIFGSDNRKLAIQSFKKTVEESLKTPKI